MKPSFSLFHNSFVKLIPLLLFWIGVPVFAQEIKPSITINTQQLQQQTGLEHLNNLPKVLEEYINTTKWTSDKFEEVEQIDMKMQINFLTFSSGFRFTASIIVQSQRPIYNTLQKTPLIIIVDNNWSFDYPPNKAIIQDNQVYDNLATLIDFYCYLVLGYDYDSFAPLGGSEWFKQASNIAELAQSNNGVGWSNNVRQGRYTIVSNLISPNYEGYRKSIYRYHRLGLDLFTQNPEIARNSVLAALREIEQARNASTEIVIFDQFFNTKYRELTSIFLDADQQKKLEAYQLLTELDASHISEYDKLK